MRLDICMHVAGLPFDGSTVGKGSLGGSESAGYYMARALAKRGHRVKCFTNCPEPGTYDGVLYLPLQDWARETTGPLFDVAIVQRAPEVFAPKLSSRLNWLWCHDLALKRSLGLLRGTAWNMDKILVLSDFMRQQYIGVTGLPNETFQLTRNGLDLDEFDALPDGRDPFSIVYTSRPERGLDHLVERIMPELLKRDPRFTLHLAGYQNPVEHLRPFYERLSHGVSALGDRVKFHGALTKRGVAELFARCGSLVYPSPSSIMRDFAEVSCITAMEAQAAGLPIVASKLGALPETIHPGAGILIDGDPSDDAVVQKFVEAILSVAQDAEKAKAMGEAGQANALTLSWDKVAEDWESEIIAQLEAKTKNRATLARHFIRRSDIIAAKAAIDGDASPEADLIRSEIAHYYAFLDGDMGAHYDTITDRHDPIEHEEPNLLENVPREPRFQDLMRVFSDVPGDGMAVLDVGCNKGYYSIWGANQFGWHATGVDHSAKAIQAANRLGGRYVQRGRASFMSGHVEDVVGAFDAALCMEVLEHVEKPWDLVDAIEAKLNDGALVYITVPWGPWEYNRYKDKDREREHIWEFDGHDLRDMFGQKADLKIRSAMVRLCDETNEPLGFYAISYRANGATTGQIDMGRKLRIQSPRQTVSANIMAGPGAEDTLHWCLKSLSTVADEIVIADCGMSQEGLRIAQEYTSKIFKSPSPRDVGFEVPRNLGLAKCTGDWVFWIDTDEKLIDPAYVWRYLRNNPYQGYSIQQHHFACDTGFPPDMPVRLFRNNGKLRFFGKIHEHPEMDLNKGPGDTLVVGDVHIAHVGYLSENTRQRRFQRNYPMMIKDIEANPDRLLQKLFMMRDNLIMCRMILSQNPPGAPVPMEVKERAEHTIALWREYFKGKRMHTNADALGYYSDACRLLGIGFEADFMIAADIEKPQGAPKRVRFANSEDFQAEIQISAQAASAQFEGKYL